MSAKSLDKSEVLRLDPALYGALSAYARHRRARSLAGAARLAVRALLLDQAPAPAGARLGTAPARAPRLLRLQLEPDLRRALAARRLSAIEALRSYFTPKS